MVVVVIYSALVRSHQSTYKGSFGPVPPLLRRCGRASRCGGASPTSHDALPALRRMESRPRADAVFSVLLSTTRVVSRLWVEALQKVRLPAAARLEGGPREINPPNMIPTLLGLSGSGQGLATYH